MRSRNAGFARSNRSACPRSFCSVRVRCRGSWPSTADTITARGTIRGKGTGYYSQNWANNQIRSGARLSVVSDWAVCSNTIGAPHEYFYQTVIEHLHLFGRQIEFEAGEIVL